MSVSIKTSEAAQIRELFVLYSKKSAFNIDEYVDVGTLYKKLNDLVSESKSSDELVNLEKSDATFIFNTMTVCSQRAPVEVQNYKVIGNLFDLLSELLKEVKLDEETKEN